MSELRNRTLAVAMLLAMTATGALAASAAETAIATRQAGYKKMGAAFKAISDELKTDAPDAKLIAVNARVVNAQAAQTAKWFPHGSGPDAGFKTRAKPAIWNESAKFAAAISKLQAETGKLQTISAGGDVEAIKAQFRATGGACKSCHDPYRAEG